MPIADQHDDHDHNPPPAPIDPPEAEPNGFQITSTTNGNQSSGAFAGLLGGNFVVTFLSNSAEDIGQDVRARFFRLDGSPIGLDIRVNETTAGVQTDVSSLTLSDGSVLITWRSPDPLNVGNSHLFGRRFSAQGVALTGEVQLSVTGADGSYGLSQRSNGALYFAYENDGEIVGGTFNGGNLAALTNEVRLNTTLPGTPTGIRLQSLSNDNYMLSFESPEGGTNGTEIRNRIFSASGPNGWTPVSINSSTNDFVVNTVGSGDQTGQRSTRLADSRILEVWQSTDMGDGSGTTIRGRYIDSNGTPSGSDFILNTTTEGDQRSPSILSFNDGRRLVWWHSFEAGGNDTIRGRWVDHDGSLGASDFVITTLQDSSVPGFTLALLADQSVIALYGGNDAGDGSGSGIQGAPVLSLGAPLFPAGGTATELSLSPVLVSPFDESLPEYDWASAAAQISRSVTASDPRFTNGLGNALSMTFAFRASEDGAAPMPSSATGFSRFSEVQIAAALYAMQQWQDVANITLTRVQDAGSAYSNNAQFTFRNWTGAEAGTVSSISGGYGGARQTFPGSGVWQNYAYFNEQAPVVTDPTISNGGLKLYMHEIGHALGLSHPGDYNVGDAGTYTAYARDAQLYEDSEQYSLMSYFSSSVTHAYYGSTNAATPMLYDIAAIQRLYGANMTTRTGDNVYGFNANAGEAFSITGADKQMVFSVWDAGGWDIFDFSGYNQTQWINLNEEAFSSVGGLRNNVSIARNVTIEDAYGGSGADSMLGSAAANLLRGNAGADTLDGAMGNDTLEGGAGNDVYLGVTADDRITEAADNGADTIIANTSLSMPENIEVAMIASGAVGISLSGGNGNDIITGNELRNILYGGIGNDTLDGLGGDDDIFGGAGNDHIVVGIGGSYLDGGAGDDVILVGNTDLVAILALFSLS